MTYTRLSVIDRHHVDGLLFSKVIKNCGVCWFFSECFTLLSRAEERKGTREHSKPSRVLYIEISLQAVTVNQESAGRSHFLSYVTICSLIGNKKRLKKTMNTRIMLHTNPATDIYLNENLGDYMFKQTNSEKNKNRDLLVFLRPRR